MRTRPASVVPGQIGKEPGSRQRSHQCQCRLHAGDVTVPPDVPPIPALAFLTAARLVINTGQRFVYPFLPAIARGLGISLQQAGLLVSVRAFAAVATPLTVAVAGRGERRRRLMAAGLAAFSLGVAVTAASGVFAGALVGFVLMGLAKPGFDVAAQSYLADHTPYRLRARYLSITELTWALSLLIGAPLAGWLISRADWRAPFWALAALGLVSLVVLRWAVRPEPDVGSAPGETIRLDRHAVWVLVVMGLFTFAAEVTFVIFGAWLEDSFGLSLVALGGASVVIGLAELTGEGATLSFADRLGKRRAVAAGLAISALAFGLIPFTRTLTLGLGSLAVALVGFEIAIVSAIPLATEVMPAARGRFLALVMVAFSIARGLAAALGPWLFENLGVGANALTSAAIELVALAGLLLFVRHDGGIDSPP